MTALATIAPARPPLRYHGSKWRIADWVMSYFPPHLCYAEPYGGGAAVLLQKQPSIREVYNDKSKRVVNFFRVLRERPEEFIRAIELTPYSRAEFLLANEESDDELENARRFYILSRQGRGGPTARWNTGWRFQRNLDGGGGVVREWSDTSALWATVARLKQVQIECDEALKIVERFDTPNTLFYVDPPYLPETRSKWGSKNGKAYDHELMPEDHHALAEALHNIKGMALVSGYPSALYQELYAGWDRVQTDARADANKPAIECMWISPNAAARAPQMKIPFDL
jgi:DNA adenine methylase